MSDFARKILEAAGAVPDGKRRSWQVMVDCVSSEFAVKGTTAFRRFLKCPPDIGGSRPGEGFFEVFLGYGKAGAEALLDAYQNELSDDPERAHARMAEWQAIVSLPREAKALGLIDWDLGTWKPATADEGKTKIGTYLPVDVAERLRVAAFQSKATISGFIESAVVEKLARIEREQGEPITPRAETATEAPGRRRVVAAAASLAH